MSIRSYGLNEYGFILTGETIGLLAKKLCHDYTNERFSANPEHFRNEVVEYVGAITVENFSGETVKITEDGLDKWSSSFCYDKQKIDYIPLKRCPNVFYAPYSKLSEIVTEITGKIGGFLPDDFNYCDNMVHIIGSFIC